MNTLPLVCLAVLASSALAAPCDDIAAGSSAVFVSPAYLKTNMGSVTVLDARGQKDYDGGHLLTAARVAWQSFTAGCPGTTCGVLNTTTHMKAQFAALGVSPAKSVVVYGKWQGGWGDEGRIHWMLKSLGHKNAFILSGGLAAYSAKYSPSLSTTAMTPTPVAISVWSSGLDVTGFEKIVETKASIQTTDLLIDTRTEAEYTGEMSGSANYNVKRDGHAKGAVLYSYSDLFNGTCLKTCTAFKADLTSRGWKTGKALVAYCTGGIRSGFFWSLATHCDIPHVSNYGGSMWEYAADNDKPMTTTYVIPATTSVKPAASVAKNTVGVGGLLVLAFASVWMRA